jgi:hypothetical protein
VDFDDPDDISTDREANEASRIIDAADDGQHITASQLFTRTPEAMAESLCDRLHEVQDIHTVRAALRFAIHVSTLYDFRVIQRMLGLLDRCEDTSECANRSPSTCCDCDMHAECIEEDKRLAGGGA